MGNETLSKNSEGVTSNLDLFVPPTEGKPVLFGYHVKETSESGSPFSLTIIKGSVASGIPIVSIEVESNGIKSDWFGPNGIESYDGISIQHGDGMFDITVIYKR